MRTTRVLQETIIPFARKHSTYAMHPGYQSLYNWSHRGLKRGMNRRITLEWAYNGGMPVTSEEALSRFHKKRNKE